MFKLCQQVKFLGQVGISPAASIIIVNVRLLDEVNLRAPLEVVRHLDRAQCGMIHLRIDTF